MPVPFKSSVTSSTSFENTDIGGLTSTDTDFALRNSQLNPDLPGTTLAARYALAQEVGGKTILNAFTGSSEPQIDFRVNNSSVGHIHLDGSTNFNTLNVIASLAFRRPSRSLSGSN